MIQQAGRLQAVLLAAGEGKRLGKLTRLVPKPMLQVHGKPVIEHNLELLKRAGVGEIVVHVCYRSDVIMRYFGDGKRFGICIRYVEERTLPAGPACAVKNCERFLGPGPFFVVCADVYSNFDLAQLMESHLHHSPKAEATIGLYRLREKSQYGVVTLAPGGAISSLREKPSYPRLINTGYYVLNRSVLSRIGAALHVDFGGDLFPELAREGRLFGESLRGFLKPIDTPGLLEEARAHEL